MYIPIVIFERYCQMVFFLLLLLYYYLFLFYYYKSGQIYCKSGQLLSLQIGSTVTKNWAELSQTGTAIKNWGIFIANWGSYYNSRKFLQIGARRIITHLVGIFRNGYIKYLITLKNLTDFKDEKL